MEQLALPASRRPSRGRPPYGYRLVTDPDVGPDGFSSLRYRLEPDPVTALIVRRIFDQYAAGSGLQRIAEGLNAAGVPCPSAQDRLRNLHHTGTAWSKGAVRAILVNPRYTGVGGQSGHRAYQPLVNAELFTSVQQAFATKRQAIPATERVYVFRGMLRCGLCQRLMQGTWNNGEPYYRCRFPENYAAVNNIEHPRNVYIRENQLLERVLEWIAGLRSTRHEWFRHRRVPTSGSARTRLENLAVAVSEDAEQWAQMFRQMRLRLTYSPSESQVLTKAALGAGDESARHVITL